MPNHLKNTLTWDLFDLLFVHEPPSVLNTSLTDEEEIHFTEHLPKK